MTAPDAVASAIAWQEDRIVAVGDDDTVRAVAQARGLSIEDATGRTVLPGFVDAHMHFLHVGVKQMRPDLRDTTSLEDALEQVRRWIDKNPGDGPVTAEGWDESRWPEKRPPTRQELDAVTDRPLVFRRIDGHFAVANHPALEPIRRRWDDDELVDLETGVLLEDASLYLNEVLPASASELDHAVRLASDAAHRLGVTAVGDYSQSPFRAALLRAAAADRLRVRVASCIYVQQLASEIEHGFRTGRPGVAPADIPPTPDLRTSAADRGSAAKLHGHPGRDAAASGPPASEAHGGRASGAPGDAGDDHTPPPIPPEGGSSPWIRDGGLKVFHDGSFGGFTAWLHEPYHGGAGAGPDRCGTPIWSDAEARDWYRQAHEAGVQVHGHAIGDAAIDQALDCVQDLDGAEGSGPWGDPARPAGVDGDRSAGDADSDGGRSTGEFGAETGRPQTAPATQHPSGGPADTVAAMRHRIEHFELPTDAAVERTLVLGVVASCQPNFVGHWSAEGGMYEHRLGPRFLRNNRYRSWLDAGLQIAFGSDGMPFGPLFGLQSAVDHPIAEERLTAAEAVWLYTARAAWSLHWEDAIGTLEAGKHADLLVLDQDTLEARDPKEWVLAETVAGGETVCRGTEPVLYA